MQLKNKNLFYTVFFFFFLVSCGSIKPLSKEKQFSAGFREKIILVKQEIKNKNYPKATKLLAGIKEEGLKEIELAEKYNVLGLIHFNKKEFKRAKSRFIKAMSFDFNHEQMVNQIVLNIASADYKLGNYRESFNQLKTVEVESLSERDKKKTYVLRYIMAKRLSLIDEEFFALTGLLSSIKSKRDLVGNRYYKILSRRFSKLGDEKKLRLLYDFSRIERSTVVAHLGYNHSMSLFKRGKAQEGEKVKEWVVNNFPDYNADFKNSRKAEVDVYQEIDIRKIGVILPLSGAKKSFGLRTLDGLMLALKKLGDPFELVIRDSKNSVNAAATYAHNLVVKEGVSLLIGGLFAETAQREYEAAQRLGCIYISLSPIYAPRNMKDSLLVELPGSVESQLNALLSDEVGRQLGRRVAIFYPDNNVGQTYLDEFWKLSDERQFEVITAGSYPDKATDFREQISNMVGLKYTRERKEEYDLWESIYKAKYKNTKRVQILQPIVDFDWIFIPSFPQKAVQIIPSFHYVGVKKTSFIGGPSWRSRTLVSRQKMLGKVFFIGDLIEEKKQNFRKLYFEEYKSEPRLLETFGYDSVHLAKEILADNKWSRRGDLNREFTSRLSVGSDLSTWKKSGDTWIKKMNVNKITPQGMQKISY